MLRCIAIDDEPLALDIIKEYAGWVNFMSLNKVFGSAALATNYLNEFPVDLIFLDIQMPNSNGMEFFKSLQHKPLVIFTTAFGEYAVEGFKVDAVDYLLKPFDFKQFSKAVTKAKEIFQFRAQQNTNTLPYIFIRSDYRLVKVLLEDIVYIEGLSDYTRIITLRGKPVISSITLKEFMEKLPPAEFIRVHRSFIISISKILSYNRSQLFLSSATIPVGNTYMEHVKKIIKR
jgi:DNA-binding LytR/AlgR family response regulator